MDIFKEINQIFHNNNIRQELRFNTLLSILSNEGDKDEELSAKINELFMSLNLDSLDVIQECYMSLCSNYTKEKLDQFYTPISIGLFFSSLMLENKNLIEPACGTGDLALEYRGKKTMIDIDANVLKFAKLNNSLKSKLNKEYVNDCEFKNINSLSNFELYEGKYMYTTINPPFGSKTVVRDKSILDKYELGKGKTKEEFGVLFCELGIKLLKNDGIMFIILPTGYLNNKKHDELRKYLLKYRVLASIRNPENTFRRSGTGVNTYLLIVQKTLMDRPYNIFISELCNIGYDLNSKNTPIKFKKNEKGEMIKDEKGNFIYDNDFIELEYKFKQFCNDENIKNIKNIKNEVKNRVDYEVVNTDKLDMCILENRRYCNLYKRIIDNNSLVNIEELCDIKTDLCDKKKSKYNYIDISCVSTPFYKIKNIYNWELPNRAKYNVSKYDILVSRLEGNISFTLIMDDNKNIVVSNGFFVLRPKNKDCLVDIISNLFDKNFKVQHQSLVSGSIMASIDINNFRRIKVNRNLNTKKNTEKLLYHLENIHQCIKDCL